MLVLHKGGRGGSTHIENPGVADATHGSHDETATEVHLSFNGPAESNGSQDPAKNVVPYAPKPGFLDWEVFKLVPSGGVDDDALFLSRSLVIPVQNLAWVTLLVEEWGRASGIGHLPTRYDEEMVAIPYDR